MPKVSPKINSFNAGEFSALVEARSDIDRYAASMRVLSNFIVAPQGPAIRRSGTYFLAECYDHLSKSAIVDFDRSDTESFAIEFANGVIRFIQEGGVQTFDPHAITNVTAASPLAFDSAALDAAVGDQVVINGFDPTLNVSGRTCKITAKVGTVYTTDLAGFAIPTGAPPAGTTAALIYSIASPYTEADVQNIVAVQSVDVLYLLCPGYRPRKLSRYASYDWRLSYMDLSTGPFLSSANKQGKLTPSGTGDTVTVGGTASASGVNGTNAAANAFDGDGQTFWQSASDQQGWLQYQCASAKTVDGYYIAIPLGLANTDATYSAIDQGPSDWDFFGSNDGATWYLLDSQRGFLLYDQGRTPFFPINNSTAYSYYRVHVYKCTRNGAAKPSISKLGMRDVNTSDINLTLSGDYSQINFGDGFYATDVDRLINVKCSDTLYRVMRIKTVTDATHIVATLLKEPFPDTQQFLDWQIGMWSDSTGYPTCGCLWQDRLWLNGGVDRPDTLCGSRTGAYEDFAAATPAGEVLDDSAVVVTINATKASGIKWIRADERGLLIGSGSSEHILVPANDTAALTARNVKAIFSTERGSADVQPVKIDRQVVFVQASKRTVREMAYVFQSDGYKAPSMSLFASHLGVRLFEQCCFSNEPHSIIWYRCGDGSVVGLTYNRDENVVGWHRHDFAGAYIESICNVRSVTYKQDTLWVVARRTVNGQTKRYIERLTRFWDFDSVIEDAHFVDCGIVYDGAETETLHGLFWLEGQSVSGLHDGVPFEDITVTNGAIMLPHASTKVVIGLPYVSIAEIARPDVGAADGTALGKLGRTHNLTVMLWQSAYGEVGRWNDQLKDTEWVDVEYDEAYDELSPIALQDGMFGPTTMPRGYNKRNTLSFRQTKPLPFNISALLPQLDTQDR